MVRKLHCSSFKSTICPQWEREHKNLTVQLHFLHSPSYFKMTSYQTLSHDVHNLASAWALHLTLDQRGLRLILLNIGI